MHWSSLNSLFSKIFAAFWLLIALLISSLTLLPHLDSRQLQPITKNDLIHLNKQYTQFTQLTSNNPIISTESLVRLLTRGEKIQIYLTDPVGNLISQQAPRKMRQFILDSQSPGTPLKKINTYKTYYGPVAVKHAQQDILMYIALPNQKKSLELAEWLLDNPLLLLFIAILISTPICAILAWYLTKPLRQLQNASTKIARGDFDAPFPEIKSTDEITRLGRSMQLMVTSVKNMFNNQQRLLSDISHELRSPLTRLRLALAITKKHSGETKELQRIELEAQRIEEMIAEMLNLSRIQLHRDKKEDLSLNDFLEELFLDAEFEANECGKKFTYPTLANININIYPELAYRAIENIIRNAIKYAQVEITVDIKVEIDDITVSISNDGPLIPDADLTNIFRPFYRLNEARDRESGGAGLGLSIAENAILKHGGKIWADNLGNHVSMHLQFPRIS